MRFACWIPKATNTHSEYVILIEFHCNNGRTNTPECYVIRTLPSVFNDCFNSVAIYLCMV